jgi:uncharacterized protein YcsI (UPF0317 family)
MTIHNRELDSLIPEQFRQMVRNELWVKHTPTSNTGIHKLRDLRAYAKMNLVIVPVEVAFEFAVFCQRNPQCFYMSDITDPGDPHPKLLAPEADVRTDLPRYCVYQNGDIIDEPSNIMKYWRDDLVAFLIGSSSSFDWALLTANVQYRTLGAYETNVQCIPSGRFSGAMVVTARAFSTIRDAVRAIQISSRHPAFHGAPIHMGDPKAIGIKDWANPDYEILGQIDPVKESEIPMFWGCGIVPKGIATASKIPLMITHYPAHLFLADRLAAELAMF